MFDFNVLNNNIDFSEMFKLVAMCSLERIPFDFHRHFDGYQINVGFDDAVLFLGSHGVERGLLECYHFGDCEGYQTADEIFEHWKKIYKKS